VSTLSTGFLGEVAHGRSQAERYAADRVVQINAATRAGIRAAVVKSFAEKITPYRTARLIRSMIGLTDRGVTAVFNYRQSLIGKDFGPSKVEALVAKYAAKKIRERAMAISRTEILGAINRGQLEEWRSAIKSEEMSDRSQKEWMSTEDDRVCFICEPMDGIVVPMEEPFETSVGELDGPPAHTQCRCAIAIADELAPRKTGR